MAGCIGRRGLLYRLVGVALQVQKATNNLRHPLFRYSLLTEKHLLWSVLSLSRSKFAAEIKTIIQKQICMNNLLNNPEHTESKQRLTQARQHLIKGIRALALYSTQRKAKVDWHQNRLTGDGSPGLYLLLRTRRPRSTCHFSVDGATRLRQLFALHAPKPQCLCGQSHAT